MTLARRLLKYRVASVHIRRQRLQRHLWEYENNMTLARRLLKYRVASVHIRKQRLQRHLWEYAQGLERELDELKAKG